jgi:adenosine deaminase
VVLGCRLLDEYDLARRVFRLDDAVLASMATASIRASGAPEHVRAAALATIDAWAGGGADLLS